MQDFEKLGAFYLGREIDPESGKPDGLPLMLDARDLTTHAVCVGMTGSGKTGLCIALLEEAAIDGIPAIIVDPKGDIANLMLTFPELDAASFRPWINPDDARRKGMTEEAYAANRADLWRNGLAQWGQDGERIRKLRESAAFGVYTPGSTAGVPLSILKALDAPPERVKNDPDLYGDALAATISGLLGLAGMDVDPVQSREHILLTAILDHFWRQNASPQLADLVRAVQRPPVTRVGILDLDDFFPEKDRFALALRLNNLIASPGFQAWMTGPPMDVGRLLYTDSGKPKISIISISHLDDRERMFTVSLLLNRLLAWMRSQNGTSSLRALFYMDEIFGYLPPVANPPSKRPLLTLLKQARAFGLGLVLATQNPVDLDYKGLSNTGTWFVGHLQTEQDRDRVLDGIGGGRAERARMAELLNGLSSRVFLMHNVHEDAPVVFHTRWVMSYLRGPVTREQIRVLMADRLADDTDAVPGPVADLNHTISEELVPEGPPRLGAPAVYVPADRTLSAARKIRYVPAMVGLGSVYFNDARRNVSEERTCVHALELDESMAFAQWETAIALDPGVDIQAPPMDAALYDAFPSGWDGKSRLKTLQSEYRDWLYRNLELSLLKSPVLNVVSAPGESEGDFRVRIRQLAREERDRQTEELREKYAVKIKRLDDKIRRAQDKLEKEQAQARESKVNAALSLGSTLLGAFLGRKGMSRTTVNRTATSMRRAGRIRKESLDVDQAGEYLRELEMDMQELERQLTEEIDALRLKLDPDQGELETVHIRPKKINTVVRQVSPGWLPYVEKAPGRYEPAWITHTDNA